MSETKQYTRMDLLRLARETLATDEDVCDYDFAGNKMTHYDIILIGAYAPMVERLVNAAVAEALGQKAAEILPEIHHARTSVFSDIKRVEDIIASWPEWKKHVKVTKHSDRYVTPILKSKDEDLEVLLNRCVDYILEQEKKLCTGTEFFDMLRKVEAKLNKGEGNDK